MKTSIIHEGQTPTGLPFTIRQTADVETSKVITQSLRWEAHQEVGSITVPLKSDAPIGELYYELTRCPHISDRIRKLSFAT